MKKIIILFILLVGCFGFIRPYTFEHIVVKKSIEENPSFTVYVISQYADNDNWLTRAIENALMFNRVTVLAFPNKQIVTTTTGDVKSAASKNDQATVSKSNVDVTSTIAIASQTKATYFFQANYDEWNFRIIAVKTQEIVASGRFTGTQSQDIKDNVTTILKEMEIVK